jgi:hypothetical protein
VVLLVPNLLLLVPRLHGVLPPCSKRTGLDGPKAACITQVQNWTVSLCGKVLGVQHLVTRPMMAFSCLTQLIKAYVNVVTQRQC